MLSIKNGVSMQIVFKLIYCALNIQFTFTGQKTNIFQIAQYKTKVT